MDEEDDAIMISSGGVVIRTPVDQISEYARPAKGVKVMRVEGEEKLVTLARAVREQPSEEEEEPGAEETPAEEVIEAVDAEDREEIAGDVEESETGGEE